MRIIDKNTDYYDFYQNVYKDDTFTFDRRNSFILTKDIMCEQLELRRNNSWNFKTKKYEDDKFEYALLQICNTFWLFLIEITEEKKSLGFNKIQNYNMKLLATWRNFNKSRVLCSFNIIRLTYYFRIKDNIESIVKDANKIVDCIDTNDYKIKRCLDKYNIRKEDKWVEKDIPILRACGVATCVDAHDIYLAFEEYFSLEKTASERREPIGTTDIDKVESHGFDKKTSFRGK